MASWPAILSRLASYRISLQAALWRRSFVEKIVRPGESAWQLETFGTKRARIMLDPMLGLMDLPEGRRPPFDYFCTAVVKGRWMPEAARMCRAEGLSVDFERRGFHDPADEAGSAAKPLISRLKETTRRWLGKFF
jgi:hypothetical protein